jgi:hypothetical protein
VASSSSLICGRIVASMLELLWPRRAYPSIAQEGWKEKKFPRGIDFRVYLFAALCRCPEVSADAF